MDSNLMSEPRRDDEPTMEEILASIRKIISEDDPETAPRADDESSSGNDDSEPMELTQMVSEDGSVVDLRAEPRASLVALSEDDDGEASADSADEDALDEGAAAADRRAVVEPLVPDGTRVHAELVDEDLVDEDDGVELDARDGEVEEGVSARQSEAGPDAATEPRPKPDGLVSPEVAAAASAAMARLKDSLAAGTPVGGKTMEDLVSEAMVPHLKAWLDENLPGLVERIVREEIEKITGRSEPR
jgi:cell pole-organizing protein PopZ